MLQQDGQYRQPENDSCHVRWQKIWTFVQSRRKSWKEYLSRMGTEFDSCHALWLTKLKNIVEID
jgi:hypothetical protein